MIDETKALRAEVAGLTRERDQLQVALAAARRECEEWCKAVVFADEFCVNVTTAAYCVHCAGCDPLRKLLESAAITTPAASRAVTLGFVSNEYERELHDDGKCSGDICPLAAPAAGEEGKR